MDKIISILIMVIAGILITEEDFISISQTVSGRRRRRRRNVPSLAQLRKARQVVEGDQSEDSSTEGEPERLNITLVGARGSNVAWWEGWEIVKRWIARHVYNYSSFRCLCKVLEESPLH